MRLTLNPSAVDGKIASQQASEPSHKPTKAILYVLPMKNSINLAISLPKLTTESKDAPQNTTEKTEFQKRKTSIDITPPFSGKRERRFSEQLGRSETKLNPTVMNVQSMSMLKNKPSRMASLDLSKHTDIEQAVTVKKKKRIESLFKQENQGEHVEQPSHPNLLESSQGDTLGNTRSLKTIKEVSNDMEATAKYLKEGSYNLANHNSKGMKGQRYKLDSLKRLDVKNHQVQTVPKLSSLHESKSSPMTGTVVTELSNKKNPYLANSYYVPLGLREAREEQSKLLIEKMGALRQEVTQVSRTLQREAKIVTASHSKEQEQPQMIRARAAAIKLVTDIVAENRRLERMIMPTLTPLKHEPDQKMNHPPTPRSGRIEDAHFD